jgi:hypothetical protein
VTPQKRFGGITFTLFEAGISVASNKVAQQRNRTDRRFPFLRAPDQKTGLADGCCFLSISAHRELEMGILLK